MEIAQLYTARGITHGKVLLHCTTFKPIKESSIDACCQGIRLLVSQ